MDVKIFHREQVAMEQAKTKLSELGIHVPDILLPREGRDLSKWAVIACDQFTSEKQYWQRCQEQIGDVPSTINLIFPECYLEERDQAVQKQQINDCMEQYLKDELVSYGQGLVYVERSTPWVKKRQGLVLALDLDFYDFRRGTESMIRPTEETIIDRLPPRVAVRRKAVLDLPHILVLINDPDNHVMKQAEQCEKVPLYDIELMQGGGHIRGEMISNENNLRSLADAFDKVKEINPFLFAIGDGNHSLASALEVWRAMKAQGISDHPCRYALVEVENIHDAGVVFEPIHRVVFKVDSNRLKNYLLETLVPDLIHVSSLDALKAEVEKEGANSIGLYNGNDFFVLRLQPETDRIPAEILHDALDPWLQDNPESKVDYIHGAEAVMELAKGANTLGIYLPTIDKGKFFHLIDQKWALPRKTFSLGEAQEKRYYLESRKLL